MYKKIFFAGIGGIGMSALARYYLDIGVEVYGSDCSNSQIIEDLIEEGAKISLYQDGAIIDESFDLFIYTIAIDDSNQDFIKAQNLKLQKQQKNQDFKIITYGQALYEICKNKKVIAICGTHGKTTTTAMTFYALKQAGLNVSMIVGSLIDTFNINGTTKKTNYVSFKNNDQDEIDYLIIEACEYKRTFLNYNPNIIIMTNIDLDHLDYYKDLNDIENAFQEFVNKLSYSGMLICHQSEFAKMSHVNKINADNDTLGVDFELSVFGEYNKDNARLVIAMCRALNLDINQVKSGLLEFKGTWRRQEYIDNRWGYMCYDDYAHTPKELEVNINSFKQKYKDKKVHVVFMPHLFSRTRLLFEGFVNALILADKIILLPIYAAREKFDPEISSDMLAEALIDKINSQKLNKEVLSIDSIDNLREYLKTNHGHDDILVTFGAGNIRDVYK